MIRHAFRSVQLIVAIVRERMLTETAFIAAFWAQAVPPLAYNIAFLVFFDLLFRRLGSFANYTRNDFLFMMFIGQMAFYCIYYILNKPMLAMVEKVRSGEFDLLLLRPTNTRVYLYASGIPPIEALFHIVPVAITISLFINWSLIHVTIGTVLLGIVVIVSSLVIMNTVLFVLAMPVFTSGESSSAMEILWSLTVAKELPYHKLPFIMKALSLFLLPILLSAAGASDVMLQKTNVWTIVVPAVAAAVVSGIIFNKLWRIALRNYTSASS
jgi:ABC-type uncharacterized transport system permease subunit